MIPKNFFFTNTRISIIYLSFGFLFLFGSALLLTNKTVIWIGLGASVFYLIIALFFIMKEYDKEYEQVK